MENKSIDNIKSKLEEIKKQIREYSYYYYDKNISKISDNEFDALMQDLIELENKYPNLITDDSPTQKIGGLVSDKFDKYEHTVKMLSLSNAFNPDDLYSFDRRTKKTLNKKTVKYFCEYKIDGLSISLIYKSGKLFKGITRGDGETGEDITNNILQINSIPKIIDYKEDLIVRGEVFFTNEQFNVLNLKKKNNNEKEFSNSRNAASGTLRQLNSNIVKERRLSIFCYFVDKKDSEISQKDDLKFLEDNKFPINKEYNKLLDSIDSVTEYIKFLEQKRSELNYMVDGVVVKVNNKNYQNELGTTSKFPKWATAYKFEAIRTLTLLEDIFPTVGRTGKITFNASLKPVKLSGSVIKSATLHNADYILKNDIRIGDFVWIKKAGDIIPKVIKPDITKRNKDVIKWIPVTNCPECKHELSKKNDSVDLYCLNDQCHKQYLRSIEHYVSKKAMNIQGINTKILEKLYDLKIINSFFDLYTLKTKKDDILKIDKIGEKMFENILDSIEKSKKVSLDKFIYSLGIHNIGSYTATILANHFKSIESFLHINKNDIENIKDIGPIITESLFSYFKNKKNVKLIKSLISSGLEIEHIIPNKKFSNNIFVFTGTLSKSRLEYVTRIKNTGGMVLSSVSQKTNYLVMGENPGSKYIKAKELNINIITEEQLEELLKG